MALKDKLVSLEDLKVVGDEVADLKGALSDLEDALAPIIDSENLLNVTAPNNGNNSAVTNNGDGTYTFGTTDNGTTMWITSEKVPAGDYVLFGDTIPNGYTVVSNNTSYSDPAHVIETNNTTQGKPFTNPTEQYLYIGVRVNSKPSTAFTLAPVLMKTTVKSFVEANQGAENAGKAMVVGLDGEVEPGDVGIDVDETLTHAGEAADAKTVGDIVFQLYDTSNLLDVSEPNKKTNNAVTNNGDGTYTFGTTDYGTCLWKTSKPVPAGTYELFHAVPNGFSVVATSAEYSGPTVIETNSTDQPKTFTNPTEQYLYVGVRTSTAPSEAFTLTPALNRTALKEFALEEDLESLEDQIPTTFVTYYEHEVLSYTIADDKTIITNGNIISVPDSAQNVYHFAIPSDTARIKFTAYDAPASSRICGFYTAETFANCSSSTLIGTTIPSISEEETTVYVPDGAKYFCYNSRSTLGHIICETVKDTVDLKGRFDQLAEDERTLGLVYTYKWGNIGDSYPECTRLMDRYADYEDTNHSNRFHFCHITDTHGATFGYADEFTDLSNAKFLVLTGDIVRDKFTDDYSASAARINAMTKPCYITLGNHDCYNATSVQARYEKFFAPIAQHNDMEDVTTTYYSLDFDDYNLKLLFLDNYDGVEEFTSGNTSGLMSQAQINWIFSELDDAISKGYHVAIFSHAPVEASDTTRKIQNWYDRDTDPWAHEFRAWMPQIIDAFQKKATVTFTYNGVSYSHAFSGKGIFVAYFNGHTHYDACSALKDYPDQFQVNLTITQYGYYQEKTMRGEKLGVTFNYVTIDTDSRTFGVIRMGNTNTIYGEKRDAFSVSY